MSCKEPKLFVSHAEPRLNMAGKRMRIVAIDCGIKANIIRYFMTKGVELLLVPWDHDISKEQYDGLFVSNGPGDPTKCKETIKQLKAILDTPDCGETGKPVFGICLGNQLLALAAGCKTYKMKYGNRGANQPCIDTRTNRCYITAQNHGMLKLPWLAARAATLSRPCGHPPPRRPGRACSGQLASGSEPRGEPSPLGCRSDAAAAALSVAGPNAAYFAVPPTTQAAEAPPPVVLPPQPVGCAAAEAVGAAGAHGPHSSHNGPPRAVGRGASRVTDAYGARARAGCTWLGSLFQEIASIPISILYSSAVPLGSSRKISPLRSS